MNVEIPIYDSMDEAPDDLTVIPIDGEQLSLLRDGYKVTVEKTDGDEFSLAKEGSGKNARWYPTDKHLDAVAEGKVAQLRTSKRGKIQKDELLAPLGRVGTPKSTDAVAEQLFEAFKEEEGRARSVALEALHALGYEVESSYTLVEK